MSRVHNYYAGPAALPLAALEYAQQEFLDFEGTGMSVMEISHRSKEYDAVHNEAVQMVRDLLKLPENYHVLMLQGGASTQFYHVPMNLLGGEKSADYVITGAWSKKAFTEAKIVGKARAAASSEGDSFTSIPREFDFDPNAQYVHITSNNTIKGTQFFDFPDTAGIPLVADMSSDIMCRPFDVKPFGIMYAGAQKNLGPSGVTLVIIRDDVIEKCNPAVPTMVKYATQVDKNSLFNTAPTFGIYMLRNVLKWLTDFGGLEAMEKQNRAKGELLYGLIDNSGGFYRNPIQVEDRSLMNAVFRLPSEELEAKLVAEGKANGFIGLKGHRSVGGIRVSMYNATSLESIQDLAAFLKDFMQKNG
ncbi:MAG: 3-phosphoserine/phosphohydroxythreonine transaminase [Candidatus Lernaella stagnicola]|nr:3-phosphoserine/phosphohydroxythreonine transaminase [Candidatus Lernaella stagnicola]